MYIYIFSIINFLIFYFFFDIFIAAFMSSFYYTIFFIFKKIKNHNNDIKLLINAILFFIFWILAYKFQSEIFIKIKISFIYLFMSIMIIICKFLNFSLIELCFRKFNIKKKNIPILYIENLIVLFLLIISFVNLYIAFNFDTNTWLIFKFLFLPIFISLFLLILFYKYL